MVPLCRLALVLAMAMVMAAPAYSQITMPCNASVINTFFTPCLNFLTNSSTNGTSPTAECCNSIKSLTSGGMNCLCLIVTGTIPFTIPINRTLAISLPRACKLPGVPLQCKTSGSPIPAPGPVSLGPSLSPVSTPSTPSGFAPSHSPEASSALPSPATPSLAPQSNTTPPEASSALPSPATPSLAPQSDTTPPLSTPSVDSNTPSATTGSGRSNLTPSPAMPSYNLLPSVVLIALGFTVLKHY